MAEKSNDVYKKLRQFYEDVADKSRDLKNNTKYWKLMKECGDLSEELAKDLSEEKRELFESYCDATTELDDEYAFSMFKEGFKLGFIMALDEKY